MTTQEVVNYIKSLDAAAKMAEAKVNDYEVWDEARRMIINYLTEHHGLTDKYQWAFKTLEILKEYEKLKVNDSQDQ